MATHAKTAKSKLPPAPQAAPEENKEATPAPVELTAANISSDAVSEPQGSGDQSPETPVAKKGIVLYRSAEAETSLYSILVAGENIDSYYSPGRKFIIFEVPEALAERFEMHSHFVSGRVIKYET